MGTVRDRLILQAESSECGLACLAMISHAHGRDETLSELRRRFPIGLGGLSLQSLIAIADGIGLSSRALRCELDELHKLTVPCVLHWDLDHYVVLRKIDRRGLEISDPARGRRTLSLSEASHHFTGIALELTPAPGFLPRKTAERARLSDLWGTLSGFYPVAAQIFLLTVLLQLIGLMLPLAGQIVVDDAVGGGDRSMLFATAIGFGILGIIQTGLEVLRGFVQLHAAQTLSFQVSGNLLKHLLRLPSDFFERRHVGDISNRFLSVGAIQEFLTNGVIGVVLDGILILPCGLILFLFAPKLAAAVCLGTALIIALQLGVFGRNRRLSEEAMTYSAREQSIFLETVRGVRAIKLAGREAERHAAWQNAVLDRQNTTYRQAALGIWSHAGLGLVAGFQGIVVLLLGALEIMEGRITLGMFFAFQSYSMQFASRSIGLVDQLMEGRLLGLHLQRLADIVHAETEEDPEGRSPATTVSGEIELRNVSFRYAPQLPWTLRGVSLRIRPGERVAIIGPSGQGKSTLLKLMTGLYAPSEGEILVDGAARPVFGSQNYRQQIGVVMQDDHLLSGSIAENIAFFDPLLDMTRVEEVSRLACVHEDILALPLGYLTLVGDMGSILSGGQKQRILLARALYRRPTLLFMDEGTANLDPQAEAAVFENLAQLGITQVMVAHRPAAIAYAQKICRVAEGALVELSAEAKSLARSMA